ncbi:tryptophan synthase subunit alpha [bacterium]|nr:tryptophan synthase subunit alpha [bacterium]
MKFQKGKPLFFPYLLFDYPSREEFLELLELAQEHSDCIEVGIPFSDPVADGPVIANAAQQVLQLPFDPDQLFSVLQKRKRKIPIALMTYANPIWNYGLESFCKACQQTEVQALIVPDVPFEESELWRKAASSCKLSWISFVSLFTKKDRVQQICRAAQGFIYLVSIAGVTGSRIGGPDLIRSKAREIREYTETLIALGFGIRSIQDTIPYRGIVDAFIVGTRIIEVIRESNSIQAAEDLFREFSAGFTAGGN